MEVFWTGHDALVALLAHGLAGASWWQVLLFTVGCISCAATGDGGVQ
jgi:hypothetical protein